MLNNVFFIFIRSLEYFLKQTWKNTLIKNIYPLLLKKFLLYSFIPIKITFFDNYLKSF